MDRLRYTEQVFSDFFSKFTPNYSDLTMNPSLSLSNKVSKGNIAITKELLATKKVIIDVSDNQNSTPLHYAAEDERVQEFKLLVVNGADFKAQNKQKQTPLELIKSRQVLNNLKEFCDHPVLDEEF